MHLVFVMQAVPAVAVALQRLLILVLRLLLLPVLAFASAAVVEAAAVAPRRLLILVLRLLLLPVLAFASAAVVEAAAVLEAAVQALSSLSLVAVPLVSSAVLL